MPRRALMIEELVKVLQASPEHRRAYLLTSFVTGLRKGELCQLTRRHVDHVRSGLVLEARMTKSRSSAFQHVPGPLLSWLDAFAASGEPARLYARFYRRKDASWEPPDEPLLDVPSNAARDLDKDLDALQHSETGRHKALAPGNP